MNEFVTLLPAFAEGFLFGAIFYGGLWWTVYKGIARQNSVLIFPFSLLLRMSVTLTGFYLVGQGDWRRLLVCLFGFIIARIVVTLLTRPAQEINHAS